jgi:DNA-binding transcriptional regulator of glucitol operon
VRRFVFAPRWVVGHVLVLITVVSCLLLADWQWGRAEITHSLQNMAYALQWPLFAVFFAVMWWRMLRLESQRLDDEAAELAESTETAEPAGTEAGAPVVPVQASGAEPVVSVAAPAAPESRATEPDEDYDPELAAYNRMLAELAVRDQEAEAARGR